MAQRVRGGKKGKAVGFVGTSSAEVEADNEKEEGDAIEGGDSAPLPPREAPLVPSVGCGGGSCSACCAA